MLYCLFDTSTQYLFLSQFPSSLMTSGFKSQVRNSEPLTLKLHNSSYSECIYILYTVNVQENNIANKLTMLAVVTSNILHARNMHLLFAEPQTTKMIPPTLYFCSTFFFPSHVVFMCIHTNWYLCSCQSTETDQDFKGAPFYGNLLWPENKSRMKLAQQNVQWKTNCSDRLWSPPYDVF